MQEGTGLGKGMVAMEQEATKERGVWSEIWAGVWGLGDWHVGQRGWTALSIWQRYLDSRKSWKVLKEGCESISTVVQRFTLVPG